jgi:type I restriction enzyme S subunit
VNDLPKGWSTRPLAAAGRWLSGGTPSRNNPDYWGGTIPWISAKSLTAFDLEDAEDKLTEDGVNNGSRVVDPGTLLFVVRGMSLANEFRVGLVKRRVAFNQDLRGLVPAEDIDARYLVHFLRSAWQEIQSRIDCAAHGTKRLPSDKLGTLLVPLPPLPEQKRIAAILDKADTIRRKRQEAIRLTEELLRSAFLEMFGDPVTNPKGWEVRKLGEVLDRIESGWSPVCEARTAHGDEWAVLKLGCVTYGRYDPTANKAMTAVETPRADLEVRTGDLLFSRKNTRDLVGATAYVFDTPPRRTLPDTVFRLVPNVRASAVFLWQMLSDRGIRARLRRQASGTAGSMPNISKERLREVPVPIPPAEVQRKFGEAAHKLEGVRVSLMAGDHVQEDLRATLTQRAFSGRL